MEGSLRALEDGLEVSWSLLEGSWRRLEALWKPFGSVLEAFEGFLDAPESILEASGGCLFNYVKIIVFSMVFLDLLGPGRLRDLTLEVKSIQNRVLELIARTR